MGPNGDSAVYNRSITIEIYIKISKQASFINFLRLANDSSLN